MPLFAKVPDGTARRSLAALLGVATWAVSVGLASAQDEPPTDRLTLSAGIHYSTGNYGGAHATEVLYVPFTVRYDTALGAAALTVPHVSIRGRGATTAGGVVFDDRSEENVSSSGLGDVLGLLTYTAYRGTAPRPWIDLTAIVKFGTGDPDRQLGTGKNDYALQADAYQLLDAWNWFASLGYKAPGSTDTVRFQRVLYGAAGASHPVGESLRAGMMWSGQQPVIEGADPQNDITAFGSWTLSTRNTLAAYLSHGLTRASPEWAVGVNFLRTY